MLKQQKIKKAEAEFFKVRDIPRAIYEEEQAAATRKYDEVMYELIKDHEAKLKAIYEDDD